MINLEIPSREFGNILNSFFLSNQEPDIVEYTVSGSLFTLIHRIPLCKQ